MPPTPKAFSSGLCVSTHAGVSPGEERFNLGRSIGKVQNRLKGTFCGDVAQTDTEDNIRNFGGGEGAGSHALEVPRWTSFFQAPTAPTLAHVIPRTQRSTIYLLPRNHTPITINEQARRHFKILTSDVPAVWRRLEVKEWDSEPCQASGCGSRLRRAARLAASPPLQFLGQCGEFTETKVRLRVFQQLARSSSQASQARPTVPQLFPQTDCQMHQPQVGLHVASQRSPPVTR